MVPLCKPPIHTSCFWMCEVSVVYLWAKCSIGHTWPNGYVWVLVLCLFMWFSDRQVNHFQLFFLPFFAPWVKKLPHAWCKVILLVMTAVLLKNTYWSCWTFSICHVFYWVRKNKITHISPSVLKVTAKKSSVSYQIRDSGIAHHYLLMP